MPSLDPAPRGAGFRFAALAWALLHAPLFLVLFRRAVGAAMGDAPAPYRAFLWPTWPVQAAWLALIAFALALPFSFWPRLYRRAAPALLGLFTGGLALDARVHRDVGFHLNGFFLKVLLQPNALRETGVPMSDVALGLAGLVALVAAEVVVGGWFIGRVARSARRAWPLALALLLTVGVERLGSGVLQFFGGQAILAAGSALPLVPPLRMVGFLQKVTGRKQSDPFAGARRASTRLPPTVAPSEIRFARTPDVVLVLAESLPADHLDERTMPHLWARAARGARFDLHMAGASATNYTLFSILYGIQAHKLDATVGAGRQALLFPALQANGYRVRVLAASCVDWMGLKETVFGPVAGETRTWCDDSVPWGERDAAMLAGARQFVEADDDRPVFLMLFFFGTHFDYFYPPEHAVFSPAWDGRGGIKSTDVPGPLIDARARNAAHALDASLEAFLGDMQRARGRRPLVLFTGDHGEEFRQQGHLGHGSAVTVQQIHVPMVIEGEGVPAGRVVDLPTGHYDLVPTLFSLLGDQTPPARYADGVDMFHAPADRFVLSTVGWEPSYAVVGKDLKVTMYAGLGTATVTDPFDRPLADGAERLGASAGRVLRALKGEAVAAEPKGP
jgi:membrane-anchored protein YejM (alkaline phosphatase superfamily)